MAWTTIPTFVAGQVLTAAQMNGLGGDLNALRGDFDRSTYSAGNLTLNSTAWANLSGPADLTLAASSGDVIEASISLLWGNEAVTGYLDVVTVVSGSPVNALSTGAAPAAGDLGVLCWYGTASILIPAGGSIFYTLAAGDISGGNVTLRLRYRTLTAANKTVYGGATTVQQFAARNHGPIEV